MRDQISQQNQNPNPSIHLPVRTGNARTLPEKVCRYQSRLPGQKLKAAASESRVSEDHTHQLVNRINPLISTSSTEPSVGT